MSRRAPRGSYVNRNTLIFSSPTTNKKKGKKKKLNFFFLENLQMLVHGSSRMKKIRLHTKYEHSSSKESHFMTKFLSVPKPKNCQNFNLS